MVISNHKLHPENKQMQFFPSTSETENLLINQRSADEWNLQNHQERTRRKAKLFISISTWDLGGAPRQEYLLMRYKCKELSHSGALVRNTYTMSHDSALGSDGIHPRDWYQLKDEDAKLQTAM